MRWILLLAMLGCTKERKIHMWLGTDYTWTGRYDDSYKCIRKDGGTDHQSMFTKGAIWHGGNSADYICTKK